MRTESLLCIAIPRVSAIFFTFQGNRLSCTTELYQPQCQPAPHWPPKCNGYGFLVCVLSYRTLRFDSGESMHTRNSLKRHLLFDDFFIWYKTAEPEVQLLEWLLQFSNASPIMSRAGMISLPRWVGIYTKLKLVHWTLDVHHSCSSLLSFTFKNNFRNFVQKKRKNISWYGAKTIAQHEISFMHFSKNFLKNATQHAILN